MSHDHSFTDEDLADVLDHIVGAYHVFTRAEFARLQALGRTLLRASPAIETVSQLLDELAAELLPHMDHEEKVLFPYIVALEEARAGRSSLASGGLEATLALISHEHEHTGRLLDALRQATLDFAPPPGASEGVRSFYEGLRVLHANLVEHIRVEAAVVFPRAIALDREQQARARPSEP